MATRIGPTSLSRIITNSSTLIANRMEDASPKRIQRFAIPIFWLTIAILTTYHASQGALAAEVAEEESPDSLLRAATQPRADLEKLSFTSSECRFFNQIRDSLQMTEAALKMFDRQGLAVIRQLPDCNFGRAYYEIYRRDLPVLITSDSILHVFHRSFDKTLQDMEESVLRPEIQSVLRECHAELGRRVKAGKGAGENYRDVDIYLTVALNLLEENINHQTTTYLNLDGEVAQLIKSIDSLKLENPLYGKSTAIYGGLRPIDYSQFAPRGHYTKSRALTNYFRAMMWLGRADCGFFPLGAAGDSGLKIDSRRELRDAVLLTDLLASSKELESLRAVDRNVAALWGESDNLRPIELKQILADAKISGLDDLNDPAREAALVAAIRRNPAASQKIQSQVYFGGKFGDVKPPPALYQVFGQRFSIDSFVLANVVYDTVPKDPRIGIRNMPSGVDAMAGLGNPDALHELAGELQRWHYAPQLLAARQFTDRHFANPAGQQSISDLWLAALRTLHADRHGVKNLPEAMQTHAWRMKQLNTQLASWAELRHDGILFVKQSYTRQEDCFYPAGYVEPYPELYQQLGVMARRMAKNLAQVRELGAEYDHAAPARTHWALFAGTMERLERLARMELKGEPFPEEDQRFLKSVVTTHEIEDPNASDRRLIRAFTGWYCDLLYGKPADIEEFVPTVADVHTDSNSDSVLEAGAGRADLAVVAVDNGADHVAYVGPVSTYYEFRRRTAERMTDEAFKFQLNARMELERPAWIKAFDPAAR